MNEFAIIVGPLELVIAFVFVVSFVVLAYLAGTAIGRSREHDKYRAIRYAHRRLFNELAHVAELGLDASPSPWAVHDTLGYGYDIRGPDNEPTKPHDGAFYVTAGDDGGGAFSNDADALLCVTMRNALPQLLSIITGENKFDWRLEDIRDARMKLDATGWTFERLDELKAAGPIMFERDFAFDEARDVTAEAFLTLEDRVQRGDISPQLADSIDKAVRNAFGRVRRRRHE